MNAELICRTCLIQTSKCISIFKEPDLWGKTIPLSKMIMACAPININVGDGFPSHICENCLKQLQFSFLFRMRILQSDEHLKACVKRKMQSNPQSENASSLPYTIQHNTESLYSIKEILESEHKKTVALNSSVKLNKNKGIPPKVTKTPKPIEEVMVPMISDILYEETIDTKVLPSVKMSTKPPKTIGEVDLTDDKTEINVTQPGSSSIINETLTEQSGNQQNVSNNVLHPLQINNQVVVPSNNNYCATNSYFLPNNNVQILQLKNNSNNLIQLHETDRSILQNLLQTQNKFENHYIVIAGNSGESIVESNQIDRSKNDLHSNNVTNTKIGGNQQNKTALECDSDVEFVANPVLNQPSPLNRINNNATEQKTNLNPYEHNYYKFLSEDEKRKVNKILSAKRFKRNSSESDCVDLTSDTDDEFTNSGDSILKITHVASQAIKKMCLTKK